MVETILFPHMYFDQTLFALLREKNEVLKKNCTDQKKMHDRNIHYMNAEKLIGNDFEATVDGIHLTDLGFLRISENLYPVIRKIIK